MEQWSEDLAVGIDKIDKQHKDLFNSIHKLMIAISEGTDESEIGATIKHLKEYIYSHFTAEEEYMKRHQYPHIENHKAEHRKFTEEFSGIKSQFEMDGATKYLSLQMEGWLFGWLKEHVAGADRELGIFLKNKL